MRDSDVTPAEWPHMGKLLERKAVEIARGELGRGEAGGNNRGGDVEKYRAAAGKVGSRGAWCASFVSWCFKTAADEVTGARVGFSLSPGARRLTLNVGRHGAFVTDPHVGAVICWHRGIRITWRKHVGIVSWVSSDGESIKVIEGNKGKFPARVKVVSYPDGLWRRRLYKIATLIG